MTKVRVRVDHHWALDGSKRPKGLSPGWASNFEVSDCDIIAKGEGLMPGQYGVVARNRILAGKTNCPLGGARQVIVEDNQFVSTYPTAYKNIAGAGRNLYYARNRQEAFHAHQADYSFTFDAGGAAYFGKIAAIRGTQLTLAGRPRVSEMGRRKRATCGARRSSASRTAAARASGATSSPTGGGSGRSTAPFDCPPDDAIAGDDRAHERPRAGDRQPLRGRQLGERGLRHVD